MMEVAGFPTSPDDGLAGAVLQQRATFSGPFQEARQQWLAASRIRISGPAVIINIK